MCGIQLQFNREHNLGREITLSWEPDVVLGVLEPLTGNREDEIPIKLNLKAVFSKYSITPIRGINFGALQCDVCSDPKVFELSNLGEFPFDFQVIQGGADQPSMDREELQQEKGQKHTNQQRNAQIVGMCSFQNGDCNDCYCLI